MGGALRRVEEHIRPILGYAFDMDTKNVPADDDFEDEIERAVDDKREGVLAADVTGMVQSEGSRVVVELVDEEAHPPK